MAEGARTLALVTVTLGHLVSRMTELRQKAGVCPGHKSVCEHVLCVCRDRGSRAASDPLGCPCLMEKFSVGSRMKLIHKSSPGAVTSRE